MARTPKQSLCSCCPHYGRDPEILRVPPGAKNKNAAKVCPKCDRIPPENW